MNDALVRLKNWRIWLGSTVILLIQALLSFNLKFHTDMLSDPSGRWTDAAFMVFCWYLPALVLAPFLVAFAPMTRIKNVGWFYFVSFNSIFILAATIVMQLSSLLILYGPVGQDLGQDSFVSMTGYFYRNTPWHADLVLVSALFALGYALDYSQRLRNKELQAERLKVELINAELQALKSQLNPHFLFNVLNGISGLIRVGRSDEATDALSDLSTMLRTILENRDTELVTVKSELQFIELYLALQKMRFNDKLTIEVNANADVMQSTIPFMVLQPLVENAIHHGAQMERDDNHIKLDIFRDKGALNFELTNKVPASTSRSGFGIGIGNNKARLEKMYGTDYRLELESMPDRYFLTRLVIPENHQV